MSNTFAEFMFSGDTAWYTSGYDHTKTMLGDLIRQHGGATLSDRWAGVLPVSVARPMEASTAIPGMYPCAIRVSPWIDWVFLVDGSAAAYTRRIILYEFNRADGTWTWRGYVNVGFPNTSNAQTVRAFRADRQVYTSGVVSVSGGIVTGSGSLWVTDRIPAGNRVGFGTADPTQVSTWYEIAGVSSDVVMTLSSTPTTISTAVPYVIEDLRFVLATTAGTTSKGGVFVVKGVHRDLFTAGGTTISGAVSNDNARGTFCTIASGNWNITPAGLGKYQMSSWQSQYISVLDLTSGTSNPAVFVYDIRADSSGYLSGGSTVNTFILRTGYQSSVGVVSQTNNGRVGTLEHGGTSGVPAMFYATPTRVYATPVANFTSGNANWQGYTMLDVPPGSTATFISSSAFGQVEVANSIDRLVIASTGAGATRSFISQFNTNSTPMDHAFLSDVRQTDQSTADNGITPIPSANAQMMSPWAEDGILYLARIATTAQLNQIYAISIGAHWTYAEGNPNNGGLQQRLITPAIPTPNCVRYVRMYVSRDTMNGEDELGMATEPFKKYYRTSGITDDSGGWTEIDNIGDLSSIGGSNEIQFMFEFRVISPFCSTSRIYGCAVLYEDDLETDSHYEPSTGKSDVTNRVFAYRQGTLFGMNIPEMRMRLYNVATGGIILDDNTTSHALGSWEYSTNGVAWHPWDASKDTVGNYIRYTATSLPDGITVRALLTQ